MNVCKYPKMHKKKKESTQPAQPSTLQKYQMNCTTGNLLLPPPPKMFLDVFDAEMALTDSGDLFDNSPYFRFGVFGLECVYTCTFLTCERKQV